VKVFSVSAGIIPAFDLTLCEQLLFLLFKGKFKTKNRAFTQSRAYGNFAFMAL
jgi:hypothetical protein